jgi:two-component system, cell cycle sensor histidine kinase PleC
MNWNARFRRWRTHRKLALRESLRGRKAGLAKGAKARGVTAKSVNDVSGARAVHAPGTGRVRVIALAAVLLLAICAVIALQRYFSHARAGAASADYSAQVGVTAARLDGEIAAARASLAAGREQAVRAPANPLEAVELTARVGKPSIAAAAMVDAGEVSAQTGAAPGADWKAAAADAAASRKPVWTGAPPSGVASWAYVGTAAGSARLIAAIDPRRLLASDGAPVQAVSTSGGRLLAIRAPGGADQGSTLQEAFSLTPADVVAGKARGKLPDGRAIDLAFKAAGDGGLLAISGALAGAPAAATRGFPFEILVVFAPLGIGGALTLLLMLQSSRVQRVHEAFSDTEQRFRMAVDAARCGIWEWDLREDRVYLSEVTGAILGWGGGGVVEGAQVLARISSEHRERVRQALVAAGVYGAFDVSFRVPDRNGATAWIDARGQGLDPGEGGYQRIIGVALDVTEERMAQARAQAAETRLRDAIESVSEAFALWDRSGRLLLCNNNYRVFFSLEPRTLKPGASRDSIERFVQLAIRRQHSAPEGAAGLREVELNDGRWLQISERRTAEGGTVLTAADITAIRRQDEARRRNEAALQEAVTSLEQSQAQLAELARKYEMEKIRAEGANKAKSEFLANMSHELRTPLNAVNGFSEIMVGELFGPLGDDRYKEYAKDILNSGQHLLALINDILDMAKIEAGKLSLKFQDLQLDDVAEDAVRLMRNRAEAAGLELSQDMPDLPEVEADYRALKQVLLNLLSNAIKFTPRGGKVTVTARLENGALGQRVRLSVVDTGIGIAPEDLKRLAQPFEQIESQHAKTQQGTGLGLALTKSLVEMHNGLLEMTSEPGQGTAVSVVLPLHQPQGGLASGAYAA